MGYYNLILRSANATSGPVDAANFVFNNGLRVKSVALKNFYMPDTLGLTAADYLLIDVSGLPVDGGTLQPKAAPGGPGASNPSGTFVVTFPASASGFRFNETDGFVQKFYTNNSTQDWQTTTISLRINNRAPAVGINPWVMILGLEY